MITAKQARKKIGFICYEKQASWLTYPLNTKIEENISDIIQAIENAVNQRKGSVSVIKYLGGENRQYLSNNGYQLITEDLSDIYNPQIRISWTEYL